MAAQKLSAQLKQQIARNNVIETLGRDVSDFGQDFSKHIKSNVQGAGKDLLSQVFGTTAKEMRMGEEIDLKGQSQSSEVIKKERRPAISAGIDYFAEISRNSERSRTRELGQKEQQINQILEKLQHLVKSTNKVMQMHYADISVGQAPVTPGDYHINFLSWMLSVITTATQKIEDSGAWLQIAKKKGGMLNAAWKKGNTSVTMSNERQVATQSG